METPTWEELQISLCPGVTNASSAAAGSVAAVAAADAVLCRLFASS